MKARPTSHPGGNSFFRAGSKKYEIEDFCFFGTGYWCWFFNLEL
jgi:hypothetical protein